MGHSDSSSYPKGVYSNKVLSDTLAVVSTKNVKVAWVTLVGGAALEIVSLRRAAAGASYFDVLLPIGGVVRLGGFACSADANGKIGLELITASAAGDVGVYIGYEDLG